MTLENETAPPHTLRGGARRAHSWNEGELVGRSVTIGRPRNEIYSFWRDFKNLSAFMENIERVDVLDAERSHWVVKAPAGKNVEWTSRIVEDAPDSLIAWESEPGADIKHAGQVEFENATGGRGTKITVVLNYDAPGGDIGKLVAKLFHKEPRMQAARDLRRLKQLLETGEIPTTEPGAAAPRAH